MDAIANAIDEFQEYSFQYNVKIVGVPEVCSADEAASTAAPTTSKLCVKLFKEMFSRFYKCVIKLVSYFTSQEPRKPFSVQYSAYLTARQSKFTTLRGQGNTAAKRNAHEHKI